MSGTTSYNIAQLRHLDRKTISFVDAYTDIIIGKPIKSYNLEQLYNILTDIDISDITYNEEEILYEIKSIINLEIPHSNKGLIIVGRNKLLSLFQDPTIEHNISVVNQYKMLLRIIRSRNTGLPDDILENILIYMRSMSNEILTKDFVNDVFKFASNEIFHTLEEMKSLLSDQISHFQSNEVGCNIWHINCQHNNYELGSVCAFYNVDLPTTFNERLGLMIQDIVKYPIPFLVQSLFPNYNGFIPKLNTILETPINIIATSIKVNYIFVRPIGNQTNILKKHYGYLETGIRLNYPCETISVGYGVWLYKEVDNSNVL